MGVAFALFQSTGTSPFAMLSTKISVSGDAMAGAISRSIADITNACVRVTSCPQSATLARNLAMYHDTLTGPIAVHKTVPVSRVSDGLKRHPCR